MTSGVKLHCEPHRVGQLLAAWAGLNRLVMLIGVVLANMMLDHKPANATMYWQPEMNQRPYAARSMSVPELEVVTIGYGYYGRSRRAKSRSKKSELYLARQYRKKATERKIARRTLPIETVSLSAAPKIVSSPKVKSIEPTATTATATTKPEFNDPKPAEGERMAAVTAIEPLHPTRSEQFSQSSPPPTSTDRTKPPVKGVASVALLITSSDIRKLSDLDVRAIVLDERLRTNQSAIRAALHIASDEAFRFTGQTGQALTEVLSGRASAAILAVVTPAAATRFPGIAGFRIFRIDLESGDKRSRAAQDDNAEPKIRSNTSSINDR